MSFNYEETPTILGYSEEAIGVRAGGGVNSFGGVVLHEPTDFDFGSFHSQADIEKAEAPRGVGLHYHEVSTITVSWTIKMDQHQP